MKRLLTILFLFLFSISNAAIFYISPTGNDITGNGSIGNPWKTLYKATTTVTSTSNVIFVNAGTYTETLQSSLAAGVSIEGAGITSIIKSTATADNTPIIILESVEGTNGNQHISGLKFDGQSLGTAWCISIAGRSNVSVHDCTAINFRQLFTYWRGRDDGTTAPPSIYGTGNSFYNNIVTNCAGYDGFGYGQLFFGGQDGMFIYGNTMTQDSRGAGNNGWLLKHQANDGYSKNVRIYNNSFTKDPDFGGTWDFCVESFNNENWQVYNNAFHGGGLDMNFQTGTTDIYGNTFDYPIIPVLQYQSAITLEFGSTSVTVQNNVCNGASSFVLFTPRDGNTVRDININNNLSYNMGLSGGDGYGIRWNTSGMASGATIIVRNFRMQHNTLVAYSGVSGALYGIRLPDGNPDVVNAIVNSDSVYIDNNIIQGFQTAPIVANPAAGLNHLFRRSNISFGNGNANLPIYNGGTPTNMVISPNPNNTSDPLLGINYLPGIGSPAIGNAFGGGNIGYQLVSTAPTQYIIRRQVILLGH